MNFSPRNIPIVSMWPVSKTNVTFWTAMNTIGQWHLSLSSSLIVHLRFRFRLREQPIDLFHHSEHVQQLKNLLNKNTSVLHHRALPAKSVDAQNVFFCRYVYDYRAKRLVKNPSDANAVVQVWSSALFIVTIRKKENSFVVLFFSLSPSNAFVWVWKKIYFNDQ